MIRRGFCKGKQDKLQHGRMDSVEEGKQCDEKGVKKGRKLRLPAFTDLFFVVFVLVVVKITFPFGAFWNFRVDGALDSPGQEGQDEEQDYHGDG